MKGFITVTDLSGLHNILECSALGRGGDFFSVGCIQQYEDLRHQ